jgi:hypothetical protein
MKKSQLLFTALLSISLGGCGKDDPEDACLSACEEWSAWDDRCGAETAPCETQCKQVISELGGDSCEEEQIAFFDCGAAINYDAIECSQEAATYTILSECPTESAEIQECAGI